MSWRLEVHGVRGISRIEGGRESMGHLHKQGGFLASEGRRAFVLTDTNVARHWLAPVLDLLGACCDERLVHVARAGERSKTAGKAQACWRWLAGAGARRDDVVVALGGGVVGDLGGFAAATYMRGVGLWQIPTSLLAQVDSSVGGKNGINLPSGKNLVGTFYQPDLVLADPDLLDTLPDLEFRNGLGEVVKYGLLVGEGLFDRLEKMADSVAQRDPGVLTQIIEQCVRYKASVVETDELDRGNRAVLNLGHTTAHALEKVLGFGAIGHGVAVALGLLVALVVSEQRLGTDPQLRARLTGLMTTLGLPVTIATPVAQSLVDASCADKKTTGRGLGFVGLAALGEPVCAVDVSPKELERALRVIRS